MSLSAAKIALRQKLRHLFQLFAMSGNGDLPAEMQYIRIAKLFLFYSGARLSVSRLSSSVGIILK